MMNRIRRSIQNQTERLLTAGRRFKRFDQIRQRHFWSTYLFQVDERRVGEQYIQPGVYKTFIAVPGEQGQGWPVQLTEQETNWKSAGRVPDNINLEILELGVSFNKYTQDIFQPSDADPNLSLPVPRNANSFMMNTVVEIEYLTNRVSLGLAQDFAQCAGPTMGTYQPYQPNVPLGLAPNNPTVDMTDNDVRGYVNNGFPAPGLRRKLDVPILLQHGETFSFNFNIERAFFVSNDPQDPINGAFPLRLDFWATESFVEQS